MCKLLLFLDYQMPVTERQELTMAIKMNTRRVLSSSHDACEFFREFADRRG